MEAQRAVRRLFAVAGVVACAVSAFAEGPGTQLKFSQRPAPNMGLNRGSDFDARFFPGFPNWAVADDFPNALPNVGIRTVRWWGSYFAPGTEPVPDPTNPGRFVPVTEEGFSLTFFRDIPAGAAGGFSMPGLDLGTYVAPASSVRITPTPLIGWDQHRVWQYEVDLKNTCLDHPRGPEARPGEFVQLADPIYWLSVSAFNGASVVVPSPGGDWFFEPNNDPPITSHWWGWHTSPDNFMDLPTMGMIGMPAGSTDWLFGPWQPIPPEHMGVGQAFELLVVPAPGAVLTLAIGGLLVLRRRR
ncbi:MAG: hypothetical protein IT438_05070 [Phycisphaerales bacterium]|nr:hypothetical protein [Phycisphaerales bacterium]